MPIRVNRPTRYFFLLITGPRSHGEISGGGIYLTRFFKAGYPFCHRSKLWEVRSLRSLKQSWSVARTHCARRRRPTTDLIDAWHRREATCLCHSSPCDLCVCPCPSCVFLSLEYVLCQMTRAYKYHWNLKSVCKNWLENEVIGDRIPLPQHNTCSSSWPYRVTLNPLKTDLYSDLWSWHANTGLPSRSRDWTGLIMLLDLF